MKYMWNILWNWIKAELWHCFPASASCALLQKQQTHQSASSTAPVFMSPFFTFSVVTGTELLPSQTPGIPLFPWKTPKLSQICHVAMKNHCDFLPVWRDWPAEEWVCRGYRVCVSLHVLLGLFACNLIRALQSNWKIDLVMLLYSTSVCAALSRMMTCTCSLCTFILLSCYTCRNQETAATISPPFFFNKFFKIYVIMLKKTIKTSTWAFQTVQEVF